VIAGSCGTKTIFAPGLANRSPASGWIWPASIFKSVDLPAPLRPTSEARTPGSIARSTPSNSMVAPSARRTSFRARMGAAMGDTGFSMRERVYPPI